MRISLSREREGVAVSLAGAENPCEVREKLARPLADFRGEIGAFTAINHFGESRGVFREPMPEMLDPLFKSEIGRIRHTPAVYPNVVRDKIPDLANLAAMSLSIDQKLVVAVSSGAIFDMTEADTVFQKEGEEAYRKFHAEHVDVPMVPGVAFPFVKRLLSLNVLAHEKGLDEPIEVVVLSRNEPETGLRFFRSCAHYRLDISRGAFLRGGSPYPYISSFNACLFLSANREDVRDALMHGLPAGLVLPTKWKDDEDDKVLRVAFDFDGVLVDDEAEKVFKETQDLESFYAVEKKLASHPHNPGPLNPLFRKISQLQKIEALKGAVRIAIVTARNAPSIERFITTLSSWGMTADETFFMGGIEKKRVLAVLKPHLFFDDQLANLEPSALEVPSVHIPFGVTNAAEK